MVIPINHRYRIRSDTYQWIIEEVRTRSGQISWESRWYFPTLSSAVKELGETMVRQSEAQTIAEALADIETVTTTLSQALTPQFDSLLHRIEGVGKE